jgi:hypothetical protein
MRTPTIHMNGTSPEQLVEQLMKAYRAVDDAMSALAEAAPNGRDYYPQPAGAYSQARSERNAALAQLRQAHQYVGEMLMGICDQLP